MRKCVEKYFTEYNNGQDYFNRNVSIDGGEQEQEEEETMTWMKTV